MKKEKRTTEIVNRYMYWPVLFAVLMILANIIVFLFDEDAGWSVSAVTVIGVVLSMACYFVYRQKLMKAITNYAMSLSDVQNRLSQDLDVPYALMSIDGALTWRNRSFNDIISGDSSARKDFTVLFPEITKETLESVEGISEFHSSYKEKSYVLKIHRIEIENTQQFAVFLYDETDYVDLQQRWNEDRAVVGLIYIDNYDESTQEIEEVRRSLISALIDRKLTQCIEEIDGIIKKLEKDKYIFLIKQMYLFELESKRFEILEEIKNVTSEEKNRLTLSIGVGAGADSYIDNYGYARNAIDMALGRGGDQAIVKENNEFRYYGGKSQSVEKATRVKARVKAEAFREIIESKDQIIVMAHKLPDIDALGAAVGVFRIATALGKKSFIVLGEEIKSIESFLERFTGNDYPAEIFISSETAKAICDRDTALVVVDVNRPSITEAPELLETAKTVVVFDHHRQSSEIIEQAVLSYIEPYASSASEMIAEIIQYIDEGIKLKSMEADAMYGGIVVDTNNFTSQTGVRTFEAAAFLRKNGADITRVRKYLRESYEDYIAKAEVSYNAEIFNNDYAISVFKSENADAPTVIGAKAANDLLSINNIKASIVLTEYQNKIYISARSIDEVNVQMMMEKIGGGGHRNVAGAQLEGVTIEEAKDRIKDLINDMLQKGELE